MQNMKGRRRPDSRASFYGGTFSEIRGKRCSCGKRYAHVGLGTFRPVKVDDVSKHHMHTEFYQVTKKEADKINKAKTGRWTDCLRGNDKAPDN